MPFQYCLYSSTMASKYVWILCLNSKSHLSCIQNLQCDTLVILDGYTVRMVRNFAFAAVSWSGLYREFPEPKKLGIEGRRGVGSRVKIRSVVKASLKLHWRSHHSEPWWLLSLKHTDQSWLNGWKANCCTGKIPQASNQMHKMPACLLL